MRVIQVDASHKNVKSEREFTSKVKRLSVVLHQTDDAGSSFSWLFTDEQLRKTPSASCGVSHSQEFVFRQKQTMLLEILGQKCGLTSLALNTSFVYRHRFYMFRAVKSYPWIHAAIGFIFAAGKVEESVQKLKHLIRITIDILRHNKHVQFMDKRDKLTYEMDCEWRKKIETLWKNNCDVESTAYLEMRRTVLQCEEEICAALGFHMHIVHPHTFVVRMCGLLGADKIKDVSKYAYDLATSSSQLTLLCLKYKPELIATVCLNIAANFLSVKFVCMKDSAVQWYQVYDQTIDIKEIEAVSEEFLSLLNSNEFVPTWMTSLTRAHRSKPRKVPMSAKGMVSPASSSSHHNRSHQPNQSSSHGRDTTKIAPPTTSSASSHPEQQGGQTSSAPSTSKSITSNGSHHRSVSGNPEALGHAGKDSSHSSEQLPSATSLPSPSGATANSSFVPSSPSQHSTSSLPSENRSHSGSSAGHPLSPSSARCDPNRVYGKHRPDMSDAKRSGRSMPSPDVQSYKSHTRFKHSSSQRPLESSTQNPPPKLPTSPVVKQPSPTPQISKSALAPKAAHMSMLRKMSLAEYRKRVRSSPAAPLSASDILTEDSGFGSTSEVVDSASSVDRKVKGGLKTQIKVPQADESSSYSKGGQQVNGHGIHHHSHNHRNHHSHKSKKHSSQHSCSRHKHSSKRPSSSFSYEDDKRPSKSSRLDNPSHSQTTSASGEMHRNDSAIVDSRYESSPRSLHTHNSGFSIDDAFSSTLPCNIFDEDDDPSDIARPMTPIPDSVGTPSQHSGSPHERSPKRPLSSLSSDSEDEQCSNPGALDHAGKDSSPSTDQPPSATSLPSPSGATANSSFVPSSPSQHSTSSLPPGSRPHSGSSSSKRPLESSTHNLPPKLPTSAVVKQSSPTPQVSVGALAPNVASMSLPRKLSLAAYRKHVRSRPAAPPSAGDSLTEGSGFGNTSTTDDSSSQNVPREASVVPSPAVGAGLKPSASTPDLATSFNVAKDGPTNFRIETKENKDASSEETHSVKYIHSGIKKKNKSPRIDPAEGESEPISSRSTIPVKKGKVVHCTNSRSSGDSTIQGRLKSRGGESSSYSRGGEQVNGHGEHRENHPYHHHRSPHSHKSKKHLSQHSRSPHERSSKRPSSCLSYEDEQRPSKSSRLDNPSQTTSASGEMHRSYSAIVDSRYELSPRYLLNENNGFSIDDAFSSPLPCNIFDEDDDPSDMTRPMPPSSDSDGVPSQHSDSQHECSSKRPSSSLSSEDEQCPSEFSRLDNPSQTTSTSGEMHGNFSAIVDSRYKSSPRSLLNQNNGFSINDALSSPLPCNIFDEDDDPSDIAQPMPSTSDSDGVPAHHEKFHELMCKHRAQMKEKPPLSPLPCNSHPPPPPPPTPPQMPPPDIDYWYQIDF